MCDLQKPAFNTNTAGYDYELRLDAYYWKWKNKIFKYTPETTGREASRNLTAPLDVQAGIVLRNLKALGYTYKGQDFVFSIDSTVENKSQLMSYDNINILDACFEMAKKWDCECWVTENIIHFGRCESGDAVIFRDREKRAGNVTVRIPVHLCHPYLRFRLNKRISHLTTVRLMRPWL